MSQTLLHLIYVHGFQGNDTTFQSFPTDLQKHIAKLLPKHLKVQSSLYPTYKSIKPISFATHDFLDWLTTQPPGPVIVVAHSMGGLLAAEAATEPYMSHRIIGIVAFDTPYLGIHPHVVITGIASLFPKPDEGRKPTERELNEHHVKMVDDAVTDDWEAYKKNMSESSAQISISSISLAARPSLPYRTPSPQPSSSYSARLLSPASCMNVSHLMDHTVSHLMSGPRKFISDHADDPFIRWVHKHSDAPFSAGKKWIIEHFQFGSCIFDVPGLKNRYARLVKWEGVWVNYWTETVAKRVQGREKAIVLREDEKETHEERVLYNDVAILETGIADLSPSPSVSSSANASSENVATMPQAPTLGPFTLTTFKVKDIQKAEGKAAERAQTKKKNKATENALKKQHETEVKAEKKGIIPARHFVVLPTGLGRSLGGSEKWEKVQVGGAHDEVAAHCGLFLRDQNLEYDSFVAKVGKQILGWCERLL